MMDYDIRHGRTYMYFAGEPPVPFGHGLSYTTFSLARLATSAASLGLGGELTVSVDVPNTGARDGDEVVQLYARFPGSKVDRPQQASSASPASRSEAGETRRVEIPLRGRDLGLLGHDAPRLRYSRRGGRALGRQLLSRPALTLRTTIDVGP